MPILIRYDELTYPEIAALPRDIPLFIPSSQEQASVQAERAWQRCLGCVSETYVLLPALPSVWAQAARPATLRRVLRGLHASLKAQGFRRSLDFTSLDDAPGAPQDMASWPSSARSSSARPSPVVLVVTGHTEQHAHHLPVNTDSLIISAIASGVEAAMPGQVLRLPTLPYGVSMHCAQFPATLSAPPRAWEDLLLQMLAWLVTRGFDKFYLLNGHGGNHSFLVNVVKYAGERWPAAFCATSFLYLTASGYAAVKQLRSSVFPGGMGHACELETSLLLHLRPDLVHMERALDETDFITTSEYYMDWVEGGALIANPPWTDDTRSGAYGQPSVATSEKGAAWLQAAIDEQVEHVRQVADQQRRRQACRAVMGRE